MSSVAEQKKVLRKKVKEKISNLSDEYCKMADEKICLHAISLPEFEKAGTVFCYVGTAEEINTKPVLEKVLETGKRLGVPKCISKGIMKVCEISSLEELEEGHYGILEPREGCSYMEPEEIELALVPCVTCSREGMRLGYGGGYYDRYMEQTTCVKAVLCREKLMEEDIPAEEHDKKMDVVISEEGIIRK